MISELRKDPISGRWIIIAPERRQRPDEYACPRPENEASSATGCPFCPGNEAETPPEVFSRRDPETKADQPGWRVRVVPNKFPALKRGSTAATRTTGLFTAMDGVGAHEVIIDSPAHDKELADLEPSRIHDVFRTYRDRIIHIGSETSCRYVQLFKNKGWEAGATLRHPHTQVVGLPVIPKRVSEDIAAAERHFHETGSCLACRWAREEREARERFLEANDHFLAFHPFASRFPFEIRIQPLRHAALFYETQDDELAALATVVKSLLTSLKIVLNDPPYNFVLHQAPNPEAAAQGRTAESVRAFHWFFEIIPVLTRVAGFEWGTDSFINPMPPEEAARLMREKRGQL
jgi:UDPglucose--hexose-1-phosphate uridylyltransferase